MDRQREIAVSTFALLTLGIMGLFIWNNLSTEQSRSPSSGIQQNLSEFNVTEEGRKYTVHPSKLVTGCSGMDCIPSIDDPVFNSVGESDWLKDSDLVVGVERNGAPRAYPLRILTRHEIVNDRIGGEPVAVTYCPLCRSALVYNREVNGTVLEFGVSGKLHNANLVMYDRQTQSYWSQIKGRAIVGPMVPRKLELVSSELTTWGNWSREHPDSRVLSRESGIYPPRTYGSSPYKGYFNSDRVGFGVKEVDSRLASKKLVYGVSIGGKSKAYTEEDIRREKLIQDTVGGEPVMLLEDQSDGSVEVYSRQVNGRNLEFTIRNGELVSEKGDRWSFDGKALEGELKGESLEELNSHGFFWFAWSKFHPDTQVYGN